MRRYVGLIGLTALSMLILAIIMLVQSDLNTAHGETSEELGVGQVWAYRSRPHEPKARVTIVRIDRLENGTIVHVFLDGLKMKAPQAPGGYSTQIQHSPFSETAFRESVTELVGRVQQLPPYREGYEAWREAWDKKNAGYFTISIAKAVEYVEFALKQ